MMKNQTIRNAARWLRSKLRRKGQQPQQQRFTVNLKPPQQHTAGRAAAPSRRKRTRKHAGIGKNGSKAVSTPRAVRGVMLPLHHVRQSGMAGRLNVRNMVNNKKARVKYEH